MLVLYTFIPFFILTYIFFSTMFPSFAAFQKDIKARLGRERENNSNIPVAKTMTAANVKAMTMPKSSFRYAMPAGPVSILDKRV
jgi:hypothetical protein